LLQSQLMTFLLQQTPILVRITHTIQEHQSKYNSFQELILCEHYTSMVQPTGRDSEKHDGGDVQVSPEV